MSKITYTDKVTLNENPNVADVNKVKADDLNEIKNVVNANDDNVGDLANLKTDDKSSIVNAINKINEDLSKLTNELLVYSGNSSSGSKITINRTWESLGKFKELRIGLFESSQNGTSEVIFPYHVLSSGDNLYSGRLNTNAFSIASADGKGIFTVQLIPYNNIGTNNITINCGQRNIKTIYVIY